MPSQDIKARIGTRDDDGQWVSKEVLYPQLQVMLEDAVTELFDQMSPEQRVNWSVVYSEPALIFSDAQESAEQTATVHWGTDE